MFSVCEFKSYREFLRSYLEVSRRHNKTLTLEKFAQRIGLSSSNLKMILSGKRHLSRSKVHEVAKRLKLSSEDWEFFETLVLKEQCPRQARFYEKRTKALVARRKVEDVEVSDRDLLADKLTIPVLVYLTDFGSKTLDELVQAFAIDRERMSHILDVLVNSEHLLQKKRVGETHYKFSGINHAINQKQYLKKWFTEATRRMESDYDNQQTFFSASTISLNKESLVEFKMELKELIQKYMGEPNRKCLVQACFQIFPLTMVKD